MKHILLILLTLGVSTASEVVILPSGEIERIGDVAISFKVVGAIKYDAVVKMDPDMEKAIQQYCKASAKNEYVYKTSSMKVIGEYILLVLQQYNTDGLMVADGGLDLVYSVKDKKIIGWYFGGFRG